MAAQEPRSGRKLRNLLLNPAPKLRMFIPFAILLTINVIAFVALNIALQSAWTSSPAQNETGAAALYKTIAIRIQVVSDVALVIGALATFFLWIRLTQKVIGPTFAIHRQIDSLIEFRFDERIQLRTGDEFGDIAERLNLLSGLLSERLQAQDRTRPAEKS